MKPPTKTFLNIYSKHAKIMWCVVRDNVSNDIRIPNAVKYNGITNRIYGIFKISGRYEENKL